MSILPSQATQGSRFLPTLTGVRALAAFLVLGLHTEQNVPVGIHSVLPFLARGYLGVDFFFVLSGFIITHVYFSSLAHPNRHNVMIFLWHRFIRLYPVHLAVLVALVATVYAAGAAGFALNNPNEWARRDLIWHLTLLHAWGYTDTAGWNAPSWSISAEWWAYLLFPLFAPLLMTLRRPMAAWALAAAALAAMTAAFVVAGWTSSGWIGGPALMRVTGEFLCGVALCRAVALGSSPPRVSGDMIGAVAFGLFLLAASVAAVPDEILVVLLALTVFGAATSTGFVATLLAAPVLLWLGEISYSIYMVHFPVLLVIRRLWERLGFQHWPLAGKIGAFAATVAVIIALAALLFYCVERPARSRLRNKFGVLAKS